MQLERDTIIDALYEAGLDEEALYEDYSGRFMYGETCLGITADTVGNLMAFMAALAIEIGDDAKDLALKARTDSMGLGMIAYFPGVTIAEQAAA